MLTCPLVPHLALAALSACTCPASPPSHPRPSPSVGRGAPEIDVFEAQKNKLGDGGKVSQSAQFAPFAHDYVFPNGTGAASFFDAGVTRQNTYQGEQQAVLALTTVPESMSCHVRLASPSVADPSPPLPFAPPTHTGFEHLGDPSDAGARYITWQVDGKPSYAATEVAQRLIFDGALRGVVFVSRPVKLTSYTL
ncbi:beta-glucan synthesis-associated protein-domain-containing protein [Gautieria morchelliformis]|nr:beta-glucan synthesis-associated protein-domain-containing protein [Gautieria morchelliformis]